MLMNLFRKTRTATNDLERLRRVNGCHALWPFFELFVLDQMRKRSVLSPQIDVPMLWNSFCAGGHRGAEMCVQKLAPLVAKDHAARIL